MGKTEKNPSINQKESSNSTPVYLVDGSGFIFRAYFALPALTRKSDGCPTGAVLGFCNMLQKLLSEIAASGGAGHIAVLFDAARKTFRNDIYPDYKAHRPPPPEDLVPQFDLIREAVKKFNLPSIQQEGFEADDLIASYVRASRDQNHQVVIVSSDKDLMQLVGEGVSMRDPLKEGLIGEKEVRQKFGVGPEQVVDLQALAGDSTDNVPGVPGIGIKTAAELLLKYGDLKTLLKSTGEIKQPKRRQNLIDYADLALISQRLVRLRDDIPLKGGIDAIRVKNIDTNELFPWLKEMEFGNLLKRLQDRWGENDRSVNFDQIQTPEESVEAYTCITNQKQLDQIIADAVTKGMVAIYVETDSGEETKASIVGIGIASTPNKAHFIPVLVDQDQRSLEVSDKDDFREGLALDSVLHSIRGLLEDPGVKKITYDAKRLIKLLNRFGMSLVSVDDTLLLSFVLGGGRNSHVLADISERYANFIAPLRKDLLGSGKTATNFVDSAPETALRLTAGNADALVHSHPNLSTDLVKEHLVSVYETIEKPLIPVLASMEEVGIKIDLARLQDLSTDFAKRMQESESTVHKLAGHKFNLGSPKQLGEVLFDKLGLPGGKKTRTGSWSTDADVLEGLSLEGYELAEEVLKWRLLSKLRSTYTDALPKQINPLTGRIHTTYNMAGAATGRLSSINPNLQNIPIRSEEGRHIRQAFVAEKGNVLVSADYSQIELRLLAHIAEISSLSQAFQDGVDIHSLTASEVFNVGLSEMDPETRRSAKAINFGIIYGISAFGLSRQLHISQADAKKYITSYFDRYPGILDYMEKTKQIAREKGYVTTLFGRRIHILGINEKNHSVRSFSERAAINAPLQGSAADIMKKAMLRMHLRLEESSLNAKMLLSVHDELLFEVKKNEVSELCQLARSEMETVAKLDLPLVVDTGYGNNWGQAH